MRLLIFKVIGQTLLNRSGSTKKRETELILQVSFNCFFFLSSQMQLNLFCLFFLFLVIYKYISPEYYLAYSYKTRKQWNYNMTMTRLLAITLLQTAFTLYINISQKCSSSAYNSYNISLWIRSHQVEAEVSYTMLEHNFYLYSPFIRHAEFIQYTKRIKVDLCL